MKVGKDLKTWYPSQQGMVHIRISQMEKRSAVSAASIRRQKQLNRGREGLALTFHFHCIQMRCAHLQAAASGGGFIDLILNGI